MLARYRFHVFLLFCCRVCVPRLLLSNKYILSLASVTCEQQALQGLYHTAETHELKNTHDTISYNERKEIPFGMCGSGCCIRGFYFFPLSLSRYGFSVFRLHIRSRTDDAKKINVFRPKRDYHTRMFFTFRAFRNFLCVPSLCGICCSIAKTAPKPRRFFAKRAPSPCSHLSYN